MEIPPDTDPALMAGYAVATWVLVVALLLVSLTLGAVTLHYRRKNLTNEKALHTR